MIIGVDIDGVMYNWEKTARYMLRTMKGYGEGALSYPSDSWDYVKQNVSKDDWKWIWSGAIKLGLFRHGHLITGAIEGVRSLHERGHKLLVVTHRPSHAVQDTVDWIGYQRLPFSGVHILTNQEPKSLIEADILIDDKPSNLFDWHEKRGTCIRYVQPWNEREDYSAYPRIIPARGWEEVVQVVDALDV